MERVDRKVVCFLYSFFSEYITLTAAFHIRHLKALIVDDDPACKLLPGEKDSLSSEDLFLTIRGKVVIGNPHQGILQLPAHRIWSKLSLRYLMEDLDPEFRSQNRKRGF